ncbi:MAG: LysM peptidoglycan-binding domain-containing protein, partial [Betaproteobacteria bacterium]
MRFNANGWVLAQQVRKPTGDLKYEVFFDRHDAVGNVEQYRLKNSDGSAYTNTYTLTYARFDGYLEQRNEATSTVLQPGTTTSRYDVNGFLLGVDDSTKPANNRTLINDAAGRVLLRDQAGNVQRQLIVAGQLLGQYGRGLDETKPTTDRGDPNFTLVSRFNPSAASRPEKAAGSMSYVVRAGDTLQAIAQSVYGDGRLWYRIAQANGLSGSADLKPGQSLSVPAAAQPFNSADSFKPYRASEIV